MKKKTALLMLSAIFILGACTSDPNVPTEMDEPIEVKGALSKDRKVGIDDDGKVVVEKKSNADDRLRVLEMNNNRAKDELELEMSRLERCRRDVAHPRLGGSGKYRDLPEVDGFDADEFENDELKVSEDGDLKMVERKNFMDMYNAEKKRSKSIKAMVKTVVKYRKQCELDMSVARQNVGLPGKRYESKGNFNEKGQWYEIHKAEKDIDDAFEIKRQTEEN